MDVPSAKQHLATRKMTPHSNGSRNSIHLSPTSVNDAQISTSEAKSCIEKLQRRSLTHQKPALALNRLFSTSVKLIQKQKTLPDVRKSAEGRLENGTTASEKTVAKVESERKLEKDTKNESIPSMRSLGITDHEKVEVIGDHQRRESERKLEKDTKHECVPSMQSLRITDHEKVEVNGGHQRRDSFPGPKQKFKPEVLQKSPVRVFRNSSKSRCFSQDNSTALAVNCSMEKKVDERKTETSKRKSWPCIKERPSASILMEKGKQDLNPSKVRPLNAVLISELPDHSYDLSDETIEVTETVETTIQHGCLSGSLGRGSSVTDQLQSSSHQTHSSWEILPLSSSHYAATSLRRHSSPLHETVMRRSTRKPCTSLDYDLYGLTDSQSDGETACGDVFERISACDAAGMMENQTEEDTASHSPDHHVMPFTKVVQEQGIAHGYSIPHQLSSPSHCKGEAILEDTDKRTSVLSQPCKTLEVNALQPSTNILQAKTQLDLRTEMLHNSPEARKENSWSEYNSVVSPSTPVWQIDEDSNVAEPATVQNCPSVNTSVWDTQECNTTKRMKESEELNTVEDSRSVVTSSTDEAATISPSAGSDPQSHNDVNNNAAFTVPKLMALKPRIRFRSYDSFREKNVPTLKKTSSLGQIMTNYIGEVKTSDCIVSPIKRKLSDLAENTPDDQDDIISYSEASRAILKSKSTSETYKAPHSWLYSSKPVDSAAPVGFKSPKGVSQLSASYSKISPEFPRKVEYWTPDKSPVRKSTTSPQPCIKSRRPLFGQGNNYGVKPALLAPSTTKTWDNIVPVTTVGNRKTDRDHRESDESPKLTPRNFWLWKSASNSKLPTVFSPETAASDEETLEKSDQGKASGVFRQSDSLCWTYAKHVGPDLPGATKTTEYANLPSCIYTGLNSPTDVKPLLTGSWKDVFTERYCKHHIGYIDTHCHIDFILDRSNFSGTWSEYLETQKDTIPPNYSGCVAVFCNPRTFSIIGGVWRAVLQERNVWGAVGCHPKSASDFSPQREAAMKAMLTSETRFKAVGEIGLDYSGSFHQHSEIQKEVFVKQLKMATELNLPIVIHSRDAEEDCIKILQENNMSQWKIHRHCFTGSLQEAQTWLRLFPNSYLGLTPLITLSRSERAYGARDVARFIPLNKLLLETDAPYFLPRAVPREEMKHSHPAMAITVAAEIAFLKGLTMTEVLRTCLANSLNMYDIQLPC